MTREGQRNKTKRERREIDRSLASNHTALSETEYFEVARVSFMLTALVQIVLSAGALVGGCILFESFEVGLLDAVGALAPGALFLKITSRLWGPDSDQWADMRAHLGHD